MNDSKMVEKKMLAKIAVLAVAFIALAGSWISVAAQTVAIDGSTGMLTIASDLVQAFKAKNAAVPVSLGRGSSSSAAMRDIADGKIAVGLSSDPVGEAERASGLQSIEVARSAVVFATHSGVNINGLTSEQACNIYSGKIKNWKDVGGPVLSIVPLTRPVKEFDPTIIRKHITCFKEAAEIISVPKAGDMAKALATNNGAIGMTNITLVAESQGAIRALAWNGTTPTAENVQNGSYPMVRRFYFIVKGTPGGTVGQFVSFVKSADGQRVITALNAVPAK